MTGFIASGAFIADFWPFYLTADFHPQLRGHMCTWRLKDEKVFCFHIQVWHIEEWKDAGGVLMGKDSDIRTRSFSLTLPLSPSLSSPLSLRYAHICTQLLVSSTDEFWENKQLQEEERTIRLVGLPNFIIYYGLPEMHTLLQLGACLTFTWFTCNHQSRCTRIICTHTYTPLVLNPQNWVWPNPSETS